MKKNRRPLKWEVWASAKTENNFTLFAAFAVELDAVEFMELLTKRYKNWTVHITLAAGGSK